jgi:hypothetical protein
MYVFVEFVSSFDTDERKTQLLRTNTSFDEPPNLARIPGTSLTDSTRIELTCLESTERDRQDGATAHLEHDQP